jgi:hypothetical protein
MKKLLKITLIFVLMAALLLALTACGESSKKSSNEEEIEIDSPEDLVKDFVDKVAKGKLKKAAKDVDWTKYYFFYYSWDPDYNEIEEKDWKDYEDEYESSIEYLEESFESYQTEIKDAKVFNLKVTDIDVEEIDEYDVDDLYEVTFTVEGKYQATKKSDEHEIEEEITFMVLKEKGDYKIIYGISDFQYDILSDLYYYSY